VKDPVGALRPSQLLWSYGPGALVDLPNMAVVTMGIDHWNEKLCPPIDEARLLDQVRNVLGPQVERLRKPPIEESDSVDPFSAEARIGVPVMTFPRWLRCVRCGLLAPVDSGLFELKTNPFRPDRTHYRHKACEKGDKSDAAPARFLVACTNGHLDDFPWTFFVHKGETSCKGTLRFFEVGASLQTENLWVKCDDCGKSRSLAEAFGRNASKSMPACRGRHPHLDTYDPECGEPVRPVLLGSTNSWFGITISALAIPVAGSSIAQLVADGWSNFVDLESSIEVKITKKTLEKNNILPGIERFSPDELWDAIEARRAGESVDTKFADIKTPEWEILTHPSPPTDWPHFLAERVSPPIRYRKQITDVLLVKRLREVNALVGFTRLEAPERGAGPDEWTSMASLSSGKASWVPASEVHGEGVFLRFDEEALQDWGEVGSRGKRAQKLRKGHEGWRRARRLDPKKGFPGARYAMLHTLAHLLIREFALECGYNAASIRERVYAKAGEDSMAGFLLYTASADSDGTLGGLVELGRRENLGPILAKALHRATVCSSDPLCSEHDAGLDRSIHMAACHSCSFVSETSCELGNRYLDRALLVPTFETTAVAYFGSETTTDE
jgi:hypothetical protein